MSRPELVGGLAFDAKPDFVPLNDSFGGEVGAELVFAAPSLGLPPHLMEFVEAGGDSEEIEAERGIVPTAVQFAADGFGGPGEDGDFPDILNDREMTACGGEGA